jgi:signal peptidase I
MNFNFELILFYVTLVCGIVALIDILFLAKARKESGRKLPWYSDYARSFFPVLLLVFLLRSFLFEPFRIPSGSLEPTLLVGDFILVNKYHYGLRIPVTHQKILNFNEPQRGDIIVFRYPPDPSLDYIKRVIGIPGDHISYVDKVLYVNGKKIPQQLETTTTNHDETGTTWDVDKKLEDLLGVKHSIYVIPSKNAEDFRDLVVPPGKYFAMGDNRDDSADSRYWGFVPEENIIGKADLVWMSWDADSGITHKIRWNRLGRLIN